MTFRVRLAAVLIAGIFFPLLHPAQAADLNFERQRMKGILDQVSSVVEKNYYDPHLNGLDWKALTAQTRTRIDAAENVSQMITSIFVQLDKLQDSHTVFLPPQRINQPLFGFSAKAYGDDILVYEVKKDGAAAAAGLKRGDQILAINGFNAERSSFDKMMLYFRALRPMAKLEIEARTGEEAPRIILLEAKIKQVQAVTDLTKMGTIWEMIREMEGAELISHYNNYPGDVGYVQLPEFSGSEESINGLVGRVKHARAVIVDLRGNHGGSVNLLASFTGYFESEPTVIADVITRKKTEPIKVRPLGMKFSGPMFVLVDSQTSSAAEMFARHFQLSKRGRVIGDRTSGRVNAARLFPEHMGVDVGVALYGVEVAVGRVVFPGGEELEKRGVTPDEFCLPTARDLAKEADPCLRKAISMARKTLGVPDDPLKDIVAGAQN